MIYKSIEFFFSVEGETEKWYLEHLQKIINENKCRSHNAVFKIKTCLPVSFVKSHNFFCDTQICHFFDYESIEEEGKFKQILENMSQAEKLGKSVKYFSCYSNLTFELWIILHKIDCNTNLMDKKKYLFFINKAFKTNYQSLVEYKKERNFKNLVKSITLKDVRDAVSRAKKIMQNKSEQPATFNR